LLRQSAFERGDAIGGDLAAERDNVIEMRWKLSGAGEAHETRTIDVDQVQRDRHPGDALAFGHQLLGDQMRRNRVEHLDRIQGKRSFTPQLSGRSHAVKLGRVDVRCATGRRRRGVSTDGLACRCRVTLYDGRRWGDPLG
jgi:hypothetical protein